jgi:hypothetical protein
MAESRKPRQPSGGARVRPDDQAAPRARGDDEAPPARAGEPAPPRLASEDVPATQPLPPSIRAYFTVGPTSASWTGAPPAPGEERPADLLLADLIPIAAPDATAADVVVFTNNLRVRRNAASGPFAEGTVLAIVLTLEPAT